MSDHDGSQAERLAEERAAIENCETQPIHDIGSIQDFGCLVAVDPGIKRITRVSANTERHLGLTPSVLLGAQPSDLLPTELVHRLRNVAAHPTITEQREFVVSIDGPDGLLDVSAYSTGSEIVAELERRTEHAPDPMATTATAQRILGRVSRIVGVGELLRVAVEELRFLTGFDRVKAYRFLPDAAGEVVAESRSPTVDSFLGLRYPAYDIPKPARDLFVRTPRRVISSTTIEPVPILDAPGVDGSLDMSLGILRSTAPVHVLYLQNMGVDATMSIPIVVEGRLWGLFAHHHYEDYVPSATVGSAAEIVGRAVSMQIELLAARERGERERRCEEVASLLFVSDDSPLGVASYWRMHAQSLLDLWDCHGAALVGRDRIDLHGATPPVDVVKLVVDEVLHGGNAAEDTGTLDADRVPVATNALAELVPAASLGGTRGALVLPQSVPFFDAIVVFRNEAEAEIRWAGRPAKDVERTADGFRLNPRASFTEYLESVTGRSDAWTNDDLDVAVALQAAFARSQASAAVRDSTRERLGLVVRELNHRVRNVLALVQSLVDQTGEQAQSLGDYIESLQGRIRALAEAHSLVNEVDWHDLSLEQLIRTVLAAYADGPRLLRIEGPEVEVSANLASMLALVLYELGSNAAKYGAWSTSSGTVSLEWKDRSESLEISWVETGGPPVAPPHDTGFGMSMIRDALAFEFDADVSLDFAPQGVSARFVIPTDRRAVEPSGKAVGSVLVVEDDFVISQGTCRALERLGIVDVEAVATVSSALDVINSQPIAFVVLDADLRGEFSGPVAAALRDKDIPFVVLSGYGSSESELTELGARAVFTKPLDESLLVDTLRELDWAVP